MLHHIGSVHAWKPHFNITCGIDGCVSTYRSFRCYKTHIYGHFVSQPDNTIDIDIEEPSIHDDLNQESSSTDESALVQDTPIVRPKLYNRAMLLLKLKEERWLPQVTTDNLVADVGTLLEEELLSL